VTLRIAISRTLTALALLGLILAPIARPAMAMPAQGHIASVDHEAAIDTPSDMDCCPDQAPAGSCGKDCPLMAMCVAQAVPAVAPGLVLPLELALHVQPGTPTRLASAGPSPPPKPPKPLT
jgi:hypothetical protein